jgi:hypothetical protein
MAAAVLFFADWVPASRSPLRQQPPLTGLWIHLYVFKGRRLRAMPNFAMIPYRANVRFAPALFFEFSTASASLSGSFCIKETYAFGFLTRTRILGFPSSTRGGLSVVTSRGRFR